MKIKILSSCLLWMLFWVVTNYGFTQETVTALIEDKQETQSAPPPIVEEFDPLFSIGVKGTMQFPLDLTHRVQLTNNYGAGLYFRWYPPFFKEKRFLECLQFEGEASYSYNPKADLKYPDWHAMSGGIGARFAKPFFKSLYYNFFAMGGYFANLYTSNVAKLAESMIWVQGGYADLGGGIGLIMGDRFDLNLNINYKVFIGKGFPNSFNNGVGVRLGFGMRFEKPMPRVTIEKVEIPDLYVALQEYYSKNDVVKVKLFNETGVDLKKMKVNVLIPDYMNGPSQSAEIANFTNEEKDTLPIKLVFNDQILGLTNKITTNVQITVEYQYKENTFSVSSFKQVNLYHANAMTWDDDAKLASFVTAVDPPASTFSRRVINRVTDFWNRSMPGPIYEAMAIYQALGLHGISYVSDPSSPVSGNSAVVDYISFARDMLKEKTGDCDDLTVLFCTLLESIGIETAFVTMPGHICMMFNTKVKEDDYAKVNEDLNMLFFKDGTIWIPVETTAIGREDFTTAWEWAIAQLERWRGVDGMNVIKVQEAQQTYPPLTLRESDLSFTVPQEEELIKEVKNESSTLLSWTNIKTMDHLFKQVEEDPTNIDLLLELALFFMESKAEDIVVSETDDTRSSEVDLTDPLVEAEKYFRKVLELQPNHYDTLIHLAKLYIKMERFSDAETIINQCMAINPADQNLYILMSLIYEQGGGF